MNENNSVISAEELEKKFDNILMNRFRLIHHKLIASLMGQIAAPYIRQAEEPKPVHDEAASRERGLILEFLERESREIGNACGRAARNNAYDETLTYIRKVEAIAASKGAEIERLRRMLTDQEKATWAAITGITERTENAEADLINAKNELGAWRQIAIDAGHWWLGSDSATLDFYRSLPIRVKETLDALSKLKAEVDRLQKQNEELRASVLGESALRQKTETDLAKSYSDIENLRVALDDWKGKWTDLQAELSECKKNLESEIQEHADRSKELNEEGEEWWINIYRNCKGELSAGSHLHSVKEDDSYPIVEQWFTDFVPMKRIGVFPIRLPRQESEAEAVCRELTSSLSAPGGIDTALIKRALALLQSK